MRWHLLIPAIPFVVLAGLTWRFLAPTGTFTVSAGTLERSPYINRLLPQDRAPEGDGYVTVVNEPVYFSANVPDGYTSVDVAVEYRNNGQPVIELGALTDIFSGGYDLRPFENAIIDALDWPATTDGDARVLARNGDDIDDAERYQIATYHAELTEPYREIGYTPLGTTHTVDVSLRGYHKFATYIKGETFRMTIGLMDMNRTEGRDDAVLRVWNENGEPMLERRIDDDGITSDSQQNSGVPVAVELTGDGWPEGVYTVELSGTSDIFWRSITTPQRYVTFINRVYIADDVGYRDGDHRTVFITNAKHVTFETFHADSAEEVVLGPYAVQLPASHEKVRYDVEERGLVEGSVDKGDVKMTGDGLFAFSRDTFFNPYPVTMSAYTDLDALNVDYVYTSYEPPTDLGDGWSSASATFFLDGVYQQDGAATFLLSVPGIEERGATVDVRRITLTYHRTPPTLRDMARALRNAFLR